MTKFMTVKNEQGLARRGETGEFVRRGPELPRGGTGITLRFADGDVRCYAEQYLESK